jgi:8-oxo-dGTP pyrophosphatase MutT (NUDIX family)
VAGSAVGRGVDGAGPGSLGTGVLVAVAAGIVAGAVAGAGPPHAATASSNRNDAIRLRMAYPPSDSLEFTSGRHDGQYATMTRAIRYQGAIVRDDHLLLLRVHYAAHGKMFWLIPGGGLEEPESEEACVRREIREETGLEVEVVRFVLEEYVPDDETYRWLRTYLCRIVSGEPRPGFEPGEDSDTYQTIRAVGWFDLRDPARWDPLARSDSITNTRLRRLRAALGY